MSETLYELTAQEMQLMDMLFSGELTPEEYEDNLSGVAAAFNGKCDGYGKVIRTIEARCKAIKAEEERLADRRKTMENRMKGLKKTLMQCMVMTNKKKVEGDLFTFTVKKNADVLPDLTGVDIPDKYYIPQPPKFDRAGFKEDVKAGKIKGLALIPAEPTLLIK